MKHNYLKHLFTALLLLCATVATAHDFEVNGIYYNITDATNKTVEVTYKGSYFYEDFDRYAGRVVIPNNVIYNSMTYNVTSIGNNAFFGCAGLENIEIPSSTTSIGNNAFSNCTGLVSIEIPNSVISIDYSAFMSCTGLKNVTIADGVTSIGAAAFQGCFGLESIEIPGSVTSIGQDAFLGCTEHSRIVVAEENAYYDSRNNCNAIIETATNTLLFGCQSTVIPNSITSIGHGAFHNCAGLKSIEIPASVASIGDMAFYRCTGLTSVTSQIPVDKLFEINSSVFGSVDFNACTLYVPYGAKAKYHATAGWNEFTNIVEASMADGSCGANVNWTFENGVLTITDNGAMDDYSAPFYTPWFNYKNDIKTVVIENGVTNVGNNALTECAYLTDVSLGNSVKSIGAVAFRGCMRLKCIEIPNSVTSIGNEAFHLCPALTSIAIPNSVTSIGDLAFHNCSGLESIVIAEGNAFYDSRNNCNAIIETATNTLLFGCQSTVIPNSVTSIGDNAFYNCAGLESIEIPSSVASIGELAFYSCTGLLNVTSQIPADKLFEINSSVFASVDFDACTLYVPYGAKAKYQATAGWNKFTNIVELEPTEITITINQYGSATYCSDYALDFSNVEGLKAYAATGYNVNTGVVTLTRLQTAREGTGLFLKGEPGKEYTVPVLEETGDHSLNMLVGTLKETTVDSSDGVYANYMYTIMEDESTPMFYRLGESIVLPANKAYLQIPLAWLQTSASKSVEIRFDDGETTDIDEIEGENGDAKTVYDLQGRAVENPTKGIYIVDGKKVFIK